MSINERYLWRYPVIVSCLLAMPVGAQSAQDEEEQQAAAAANGASGNAVQLKRVRVSAARPQVRQQTTLSAQVDGKMLEQERLYRIEDLPQAVTGMDIAAADTLDTRVTIRGIGDGGGSEINIGMPSSVGLFLDGVRLSRPGMLANDLLDIDSVNVLKGPQGTLYGFNTTGGAVDIRSRKPTFTPAYALEQSIGQRGYVQSKLMASGALSDTLAGRINLSHTENGGHVTNVENGHKLGGGNNSGARGQLLWQPQDNFDLRFIGDYSEATSYPVMSLVGTHAVNGTDGFLTRAQALGVKVVEGRNVALDDETKNRVTQGGAALEANLRLENGFALHSLSSWRFFRFLPKTADALNIPLYANSGADVRDRIWEQRFWIDSPKGGLVDYTLGADYWGENMDTFAHDYYYDGSQVTSWYGNTSNTGKFVQRFGELNDKAFSTYANGTWHLGDSLDLITGVRQTYEKKTGSFKRINKNDFDSGELAQTNHLPAATISANWYATPNVTPYLTVAYAEKAGGLNISSGAAQKAGLGSLYIEPEKTRAVELGVKTHWFQRKLEWNTVLFWSEVRDFQTTAYDEETLSSYLINAGEFRSRGIESQLSATPVEGLSLSLNGTLLDASYLDFSNAKCPAEISLQAGAPATCDLTGQRVFNSPRLSYNARIRYEWNTVNNLQAFVSGQWSWRSWAYGTVDNSAYTRIPDYGVLNLATGLSGKQGDHGWHVSLWVKNALDKTYYRVMKAGDYGSAYGSLGEPRMVGLTVGYDFKG
ncbi:TonB-dependent receptor [Brenneria goodwinii]|uniref:TonB-dependent receptor n=1 Tax=Brenneria goodwinii TaxID=1109412 RepID=UPI000EF252F2|nr:TonB-dependent receptor [Brenneria goodwinii]MCG8158287.1 TonB-dependent receptor [Brenneria goodwinii]MCG8162375.1 TonB-dependent receptor [Brenneria goodwinii]MCG8167337.1 TonB-dependent receptor [Brenneria goodwinii]MCG8171995.1 TonB-dependent receptor [Brenneria goodwinii]MCG8175598.1 TonB-dependent receptor [Brenneria goodwinii]